LTNGYHELVWEWIPLLAGGGEYVLADSIGADFDPTIDNLFTHSQTITGETASTVNALPFLNLAHNSTGTPAAGFGGSILFKLESSTTNDRDAGRINVIWADSTDGTRVSYMGLNAVNIGGTIRPFLRGYGVGSVSVGSTSPTTITGAITNDGISNAMVAFTVNNTVPAAGKILMSDGAGHKDSAYTFPTTLGANGTVLGVSGGVLGFVAVGGGSGTVTNTGGNLTANAVVLGAGTVDTKVIPGVVTDGTSKLTLGVAGTSVGAIAFNNATSGTLTLQPVTGPLASGVISLETGTYTLVGTSITQTLTNKTLSTPTVLGAASWQDNARQTFNPGVDNAGINVGSVSADPGSVTNGDLWYNTTANALNARINGAIKTTTSVQILQDTNTINLWSTGVIGWSPTANSNGGTDVGLYRNAAGVLEVNSGTSAAYRDLVVRGLRTNAVNFASRINPATEGTRQAFTDSTTNVAGATITGGGSNHVSGYYNGTDWVVDSGAGEVTATSTTTLTNKRITKRLTAVTNTTTWSINTDNCDVAENTGLTGAVAIDTTGTPTNPQTLWIVLTGTAARGITWDSSDFEPSTVALPTTTVSTNRLDVGFTWNAATSKWRCVASQ
jgi:hypothetical protein